jgi:hypothetical protein
MILSKNLTRLGGVVAVAALLLSAGFAFTSTARAQAPMLLYGPAESLDSVIGVLVDGTHCKDADVGEESSSSTGFLWVAQIDDGECGASAGSVITFTLDGAATNETETWAAGGAPDDVAVGITLTLVDDGGVTPPDTGDAGLVVVSVSSPWLALGLGALAVAMLAGARTATGRSRYN